MTRSSWSRTSCAIFICRKTKGAPGREIACEAVSEVGNPTILATFAVIAAVLPMAFVGGLMGPYMRPDSHRGDRGDVLVAGDRVHRHALGVDPHAAMGKEIFLPDQRHASGRGKASRTSRMRKISSPASTGESWGR